MKGQKETFGLWSNMGFPLSNVQEMKITFVPFYNIYIFIAVALDESIFLNVLHFPMKNIKSCDLEATPMSGMKSKPASDFVYSCWRDVGRVSP